MTWALAALAHVSLTWDTARFEVATRLFTSRPPGTSGELWVPPALEAPALAFAESSSDDVSVLVLPTLPADALSADVRVSSPVRTLAGTHTSFLPAPALNVPVPAWEDYARARRRGFSPAEATEVAREGWLTPLSLDSSPLPPLTSAGAQIRSLTETFPPFPLALCLSLDARRELVGEDLTRLGVSLLSLAPALADFSLAPVSHSLPPMTSLLLPPLPAPRLEVYRSLRADGLPYLPATEIASLV